jgi:hypothetical protein
MDKKKPLEAASSPTKAAIEKRAGLAPDIASIPRAFGHAAKSVRTAAAELPTLSADF